MKRLPYLLFLLLFSSGGLVESLAQPAAAFEWTPCPFNERELGEPRLRCGYLRVPENREKTDGRRLRIAVAVAESTDPEIRKEPVVFLNGGPGRRALPEWISRMRRLVGDRTLIVFDYRGSGASEPDMCPGLQETLFNIRALDLSLKERQAVERGAFLACRDRMLRQGTDLSAYQQFSISADLEDLRRALGYERWDLLAGSYGTRVALTALRRAPESIRSLVLVNPVSLQESHVVQAVPNMARALGLVFKACASDPACRKRYPQLERDFYEVHAALKREPLLIPLELQGNSPSSFTVNASDYLWIISNILNSEASLPGFPQVVEAFKNRSAGKVSHLLQQIAGDPSQHMDLGLLYSAACYQDGTAESHEQWKEQAERHPEPLQDLGYWLLMCEDLHPHRVSAAERLPLPDNIPSLIITGEFDYITPSGNAGELQEAMPGSHHFQIPGMPHFPSSRSFPCISLLIQEFLDAPEKEPGAACLTALPEMRFAIQQPE